MIDNDQITALAREYAEEKTDAISFKAYADPEFKKKLHIRGCTNDAKKVIDWLTHRFCLVEKEAINNAYQQAIKRGKHAHVKCHVESRANLRLLESLFPEIAKEVEE